MVIRVYALLDPVTLDPRYVGITRFLLLRRLAYHLKSAKTRTSHLANWLCSLSEDPEIVLLEEVDDSRADEAEVRWILSLQELGYSLVNATTGGRSSFTLSEKSRASVGQSKKGKPNTELHNINIALAQLGRPHPHKGNKKPKTHCPHGHPYSEENTFFRAGTQIKCCRTCARESVRQRRRNLKS